MMRRLIYAMAMSWVSVGFATGADVSTKSKGDEKGGGDAPNGAQMGEVQPMQIQAEGGMRLEQAKGYGRFFGGVILISPMDGVVMNAKELEVYFEATSEGGGGGKAQGGEAGAKGESKQSADAKRAGAESGQKKGGTDGLRQVVATGEVAIVRERKRPDGVIERSVAKAQRAVYEAATGNVTLTGWPQVKNGENVVSALSEETVIVMNEKGVLDVQGKAKGSFVRDASTLKGGDKAGETEGKAR